MVTTPDIKKEFMNEFKELLEKYDAEFQVKTKLIGDINYHHETQVPMIYFNTQFKGGRLIRAFDEIELPKFLDGAN